VVFALAAAIYGRLADRLPVRLLITVGLLLFNAGAILGLTARWYPWLVGARLIQAAGGGSIPALGMLAATRYFPVNLRGQMLGALASTVAFAAGVGPIIGGLIAGNWHWRYLFLLSLFNLAAIPFYRRLLPDEPIRKGRFDWVGTLLLGVVVGSFLVFAAQGLWIGLGAGLLLIPVCSRHFRRQPDPFVPPSLFRNRGYLSGLAATFLTVGAVFGMFFLVPLLLRQVHALSTQAIGLTIFPGALSASILGIWGGRLADRRGSPTVVFMGQGFLAAGFLGLAFGVGDPPWVTGLCLIVGYTGFAFVQSSLAKTVSTILPSSASGMGMGFYNLTFFTSGAFGTAAFGKLLAWYQVGPNSIALGLITASYRNLFLIAAAVVLAAGLAFIPAARRREESTG